MGSNPPLDYCGTKLYVHSDFYFNLIKPVFFQGCNFLKYVTRFSCDTFGFFVAWVYLQYGVQVITRQFSHSTVDGAFVQIILALVMLVTSFL